MTFRTIALFALLLLALALILPAPTPTLAQTIPTRTPTPEPGGGTPPPTSPPPATEPPPGATEPPGPLPTDQPTSTPGAGTPTSRPATSTPTPRPGTGTPTAQPGTGTPTARPGTATPTTRPGTGTPRSTTPAGATPPGGGNATLPPPGQSATRSSALPVVVVADPVCGVPAVAQTNRAVTLRSGPDVAYAGVAEVAALQRLPIIGRYATGTWWFVQLDATLQGWVADEDVIVIGYTALAPLLAAPPLNGITPTPAALWNPTPVPDCVCFGLVSLRPLFEPTYVRAGPGSDYGIVTSLTRRDIRLVTGRYAFGDWWQIEAGEGLSGWVINSAVQLSGYTGIVPVVEAPLLNGAPPTPGPVWNPPPMPRCSHVTPVPTSVPGQTDVFIPAAPVESGGPTPIPPSSQPQITVSAESGAVGAQLPPTPTDVPPPISKPAGGGNSWLLIAGGVLVAGGLAGFFLTRKRPA